MKKNLNPPTTKIIFPYLKEIKIGGEKQKQSFPKLKSESK